MPDKLLDLTDLIIRFEQGELEPNETLELFAALIRNGHAWTLQGHNLSLVLR